MTSKYGNVKTDGYDSKREAIRASELKLLERAGKITDLESQREFVLISKSDWGQAIKYRCDFCYRADGIFTVEDVKSPITAKNPVYRLKRRLMQEVYGITIKEVS
jgi:hypothetical protein